MNGNLPQAFMNFINSNNMNLNTKEFAIKDLNEISQIGDLFSLQKFKSYLDDEKECLLTDKYVIGDTLGGELLTIEKEMNEWRVFCYYEMGPFNDEESIELAEKHLVADSFEEFLNDLISRNNLNVS